MATIALCPLPELGHVLPTLQLAKALRRAGHRVVYVGLEDVRAVIEREGFELVAICGASLPIGSLAAMRARARASRVRAFGAALESAWCAVAAHALLLGREDRQLGFGADLALCDRDWEEPALAFTALGTRVAMFSASLWGAYPGKRLRDYLVDLEVPPMSSPSPPSGPVHASMAWASHAGGELVARVLRETQQLQQGEWARVVERRRALRRDHGSMLVMCPEDFDFPRRGSRGGVVYCGPCIDLDRLATPPDDIPIREPFVYCTIGSQSHRMRDGVLRTIVDAARLHGWNLVIGIGDAIDPAELGEPTDRIVIRRELPQLRLLARARAAIVHGGLGTIKECIWFGVPMLVLPGDYDQPGNAARVEYHGLGLARSRARIDAPELGPLVDRLVGERDRRDRLARWSARFRELEAAELHVAAIEAALRP